MGAVRVWIWSKCRRGDQAIGIARPSVGITGDGSENRQDPTHTKADHCGCCLRDRSDCLNWSVLRRSRWVAIPQGIEKCANENRRQGRNGNGGGMSDIVLKERGIGAIKKLPLDQELTFDEVSTLTGIHVKSLRRARTARLSKRRLKVVEYNGRLKRIRVSDVLDWHRRCAGDDDPRTKR